MSATATRYLPGFTSKPTVHTPSSIVGGGGGGKGNGLYEVVGAAVVGLSDGLDDGLGDRPVSVGVGVRLGAVAAAGVELSDRALIATPAPRRVPATAAATAVAIRTDVDQWRVPLVVPGMTCQRLYGCSGRSGMGVAGESLVTAAPYAEFSIDHRQTGDLRICL